jgi:uncharacterized protein (TIGR03437 family)
MCFRRPPHHRGTPIAPVLSSMPQQRRNRRVSKLWAGYFGTLVRRFATQYWLISTAFFPISCIAQPSGIVYSTTVSYTGNPAPSGSNIFFPAPTVEVLLADASGNTYMAGAVTSGGLPATPGVVQPNYDGGTFNSGDILGSPSPNVFLAKFDSGGKLLFLTYLGGTTINVPYGLAVDKAGNIYLGVEAGFSYIQQGPSYVAKISADGTALRWVTFLTGGALLQLTMAPDGSLYCLTQDALASTGTLTKLSEGGKAPATVSLPPGTQALAAGPDGSVYIGGQTTSPTGVNGFVAKMNPSLSGFAWHTSVQGDPNLIQLAPDGSLWASGTTTDASLPVTPGALQPQPSPAGEPTGFLVRISADGSQTLAATYLPAPLASLALDNSGNVIFSAVRAFEDDYFTQGFEATPGAQWPCQQPAPGTYPDLSPMGFLGKIDPAVQHLLWGTWTGPSVPVGIVTLDNNGNALAGGNVPGRGDITLTAMTPLPGDKGLVESCIAQSGSPNLSGPLAPGEVFSIYGAGFGPRQGVSAQPSGDSIGTELGGLQVLIEGTPAPLLYVSSSQINLVAPYFLNGRTAAHIKIVNADTSSNEVVLGVRPSSPEIFTTVAGDAVINQDGTVNDPDNPAHTGETVSMFVSGVGQTIPAGMDDSIPQAAGHPPVLPVLVQLNFTFANVTYAGDAPGLVSGVTQVNFQVPQMANYSPGPPYQALMVLTAGTASSGMIVNYEDNVTSGFPLPLYLWYE